MRILVPKRNQPHRQVFSSPVRAAVLRSPHDPLSPSVSPGLQLDFTRIPSTARSTQRKPAVSSPGDPFEREADEAAEKVMRMAEPAPIGPGPAGIQRKCAECEDEEKKRLQTKPSAAVQTGAALDTATAVRAAEQGGAPLPGETRAYFEPRFRHDFSRVRVHADDAAAAGARAVRARAFTLGRDIVFGSGEYAPATLEGKRLLAHELVHVVQQGAGASTQPATDTRIARQTADEDEAGKQAAKDEATTAEKAPPAVGAPQAETGSGTKAAPAATSTATPSTSAPPAAAKPAFTAGRHTPAPAGMAVCPDAPPLSLVIVGCTATPSAPPLAAEKAVLPAPGPGRFGGDADRAKFAKELAQCHAEREVKGEIEKRFQSDVAAAEKRAAQEAKADKETAVKAATEGLDPKDKKAINRAQDKAAAEAKKAAAKKIADAKGAVTRQDVAAVTAELATKYEDALAADYDETIKGALARFKPLDVMQKRLDKERKRLTEQKSAKPKVPKGAAAPPAKSSDEIAIEVEAEMVQVRCDQTEWARNELEGYSHAWAVGRREQVDFSTISQKATYLKDFKPAYEAAPADRVQIPANLQGDKNMPGVAPELADFLTQLAADPNAPAFTADNYSGHGLGAWADKGFSTDIRLKGARDVRGFWQHTAAVAFLLALNATAKKLGARWRVLYNDFGVAQEVNQATGSRNVEFVGGSGSGKINWHGPAPLILHFHLDLEIPQKKKPAAAAPTPP